MGHPFIKNYWVRNGSKQFILNIRFFRYAECSVIGALFYSQVTRNYLGFRQLHHFHPITSQPKQRIVLSVCKISAVVYNLVECSVFYSFRRKIETLSLQTPRSERVFLRKNLMLSCILEKANLINYSKPLIYSISKPRFKMHWSSG
jgi:hypothetical protein